MSKPNRAQSGRTNLASCAVATIFLIFVVVVALIVFFTVFKPKDPKISVNAVQVPSFSASNSSVHFTFSQYVGVYNPNKAVFSHYDSTLQLIYSGSQVGFLFIPAGKIDPGETQYMTATVTVQPFSLRYRASPTMEVESRIEMAGRIRVLHFFTHHVEAKAHCHIAIAASDGSVVAIHC